MADQTDISEKALDFAVLAETPSSLGVSALKLILYAQTQTDEEIRRAYEEFYSAITTDATPLSFDNEAFTRAFNDFSGKIHSRLLTIHKSEEAAEQHVESYVPTAELALIQEEYEKARTLTVKQRGLEAESVRRLVDAYINRLRIERRAHPDAEVLPEGVADELKKREEAELLQQLEKVAPGQNERDVLCYALSETAIQTIQDQTHTQTPPVAQTIVRAAAKEVTQEMETIIKTPGVGYVEAAVLTPYTPKDKKVYGEEIIAHARVLRSAFPNRIPSKEDIFQTRLSLEEGAEKSESAGVYYAAVKSVADEPSYQGTEVSHIIDASIGVVDSVRALSLDGDSARRLAASAPVPFFRSLSPSPAAKTADAIMRLLPEKAQMYVQSAVIGETLRSIISKPERLAELVGTSLAGSKDFRDLLRSVQIAGVPKPKLEGLRGAVDDVLMSVLTGPRTMGFAEPAAAGLLKTMFLGRKVFPYAFPVPGAGTGGMPVFSVVQERYSVIYTVELLRVYFAGASYRKTTDRPSLGLDTGNIIQWVFRLTAKGAGKKATQEIVSVAGKTTSGTAIKKVVTTFITGISAKIGSTALGKLIGSAIGWLGGPVGAIVGFVVGDVVVRAGSSFINKLKTGEAFPLIGRYIKAGIEYFTGTRTLPKEDKGPIVVTLAIIACVVLFSTGLVPGLSSVTGGTIPQEIARDAALIAPVGAGPGGPEVPGAPWSSVPVSWAYTGEGEPPIATITSCPASGTITQSPGGSFSHSNANAYDIANAEGTPIYASHDGFVAQYHDGIPANTFENGSYGNFVILVAKSAEGSNFYTMYAHLLTVDPRVKTAYDSAHDNDPSTPPIVINAGEEIGTMDATGSTYGSGCGESWCPGIHLHYELRGADFSFLPAGCP